MAPYPSWLRNSLLAGWALALPALALPAGVTLRGVVTAASAATDPTVRATLALDFRELELLRAEALYWAGRKRENLRAVEDLEDAYDTDPRVHFSAGLVFSRTQQFERAETAFARALAKSPAR